MNPNLFYDSYVTTLPMSHSSNDNSSIIVSCDHNDNDTSNRIFRIATTNHSIEINVRNKHQHQQQQQDVYHNGYMLNMATSNLPQFRFDSDEVGVDLNKHDDADVDNTTSSNNSNNNDNNDQQETVFITIENQIDDIRFKNQQRQRKSLIKGSKTTNDSERFVVVHDQQCIIAHSFLPLFYNNEKKKKKHDADEEEDFFLEVFIVKVNQSATTTMNDDNQYSTSKRGHQRVISNDPSQSSLEVDKKKDDPTIIQRNDSTMTQSKNKSACYSIVFRGYLPQFKHYDTRDSQKIQSNKEMKSQKRSDHKKDKNRRHNFLSALPILCKPTMIKLYSISSMLNSCNNQDQTLQLGMIIGYDTKLQLYQLSNQTIDNENSQSKATLFMKQKKLYSNNYHQSSLGHSQHHDLISLLLSHNESSEGTTTTTPTTTIPTTSFKRANNALIFETKIMTIDSILHCDDKGIVTTYIAVGCQSGNIRIIYYDTFPTQSCEEASFLQEDSGIHVDHNSKYMVKTIEFLVDGPIRHLRFCTNTTLKTLDLIVGTSCGYACVFRKSIYNSSHDEDDNNNIFHQVPDMIVEGLWNPKKKIDDSISCLSNIPYIGITEGEIIAIGTQSGRVLLFTRRNDQKSNKKSNYSLLWHVQLYHPIHSITYSLDDTNSSPILIIMTQRTIHLFCMDIETCIENIEANFEHMRSMFLNQTKHVFDDRVV